MKPLQLFMNLALLKLYYTWLLGETKTHIIIYIKSIFYNSNNSLADNIRFSIHLANDLQTCPEAGRVPHNHL